MMKRTTICLCFLFLMFMFSSQAADYKILTDGVVVHPEKVTGNGAKSIRLQVVSDQIIHVIAIPSNDFSAENSLMIKDYPHNKVIGKRKYIKVGSA
ncbi:MAG: hypothetical protein Q8905_10525 [Bacteroidota bacterium]|nr:hypothetical protein [Bacteroidota bacterium]